MEDPAFLFQALAVFLLAWHKHSMNVFDPLDRVRINDE
jgi:hypothetical protein